MSEVPHVIEPPQHKGEKESPLGKIVAAWIVCATLAAALVGYAEARAVTSKDDASRTAETAGIAATRSAIAAEQRFDARYEAFALADELRYRAALAEWRSLAAPPGPARTAAARERDAQTRLAGAAERLVPNRMRLFGPNGPYVDVSFPDRAAAESRRAFFVLSGRQDAANVEGTAWGKHVAAYAAVLTLLAVALYLLGFSYRLSLRERKAFIFLGIAFSLVGIAWGARTIASTPPHISEEAASAYADGTIELQAATGVDADNRAIADFDRALALRPNFALALAGRSGAMFDAGSPQQDATYTTLTKPPNLRAAYDDMRRAVALGVNEPDALSNLGTYEFYVALDAPAGSAAERTLLERALQHTNSALRITAAARRYWHGVRFALVALDAAAENYRPNRAVILLASGRRDEAAREYIDAMAVTAKEDRPALVAGALSDLETLAAHRPDRRADVTVMKELLVKLAWPSKARATSHPVIRGGQLDVWPTLVQITRLHFTGFDRGSDRLVLVVYTEPPGGLGWYARESATGEVAAGDLYRERAGYYIQHRPPGCLPVGRYRTELYVDGKLAQRPLTTESAHYVQLAARPSRNMQFSLCAPQDWPRSSLSLEGVLEGYRSRDGRSGVYSLEIPQASGRSPADELQTVFERLGLKPVRSGKYDDYFLGLDHGESLDYTLPDGRMVRAGTGTDGDEVFVGVVYGPRSGFDFGATLADVFDSFS